MLGFNLMRYYQTNFLGHKLSGALVMCLNWNFYLLYCYMDLIALRHTWKLVKTLLGIRKPLQIEVLLYIYVPMLWPSHTCKILYCCAVNLNFSCSVELEMLFGDGSNYWSLFSADIILLLGHICRCHLQLYCYWSVGWDC